MRRRSIRTAPTSGWTGRSRRRCRVMSLRGSARVPAVPAACEKHALLGAEGCKTNGIDNFRQDPLLAHAGSRLRIAGHLRAVQQVGHGLRGDHGRSLTPRLDRRSRVSRRRAHLRDGARGRSRLAHRRARRVLRDARAVGLGQDHLPAADRRLRPARRRAGAARWAGRFVRVRLTSAASTRCSRTTRCFRT